MPARPLNPAHVCPTSAAQFDLLADGQWHSNAEIAAVGIATCVAQERDKALRVGKRVRSKTLSKGVALPEDDIVASGAKETARNVLMVAVRSGRVERDGDRHRMFPQAVSDWVAARTATPAPAAAPVKATATATKAAPSQTTTTTATTPATATSTATATTAEAATTATVTPISAARGRKPLVFGGMPEAEGFTDAPLTAFTRVHYRTDFPIPMAQFRADLPTGTTVSHDEGTGLYRVDHPTLSGADLAVIVKDWCAEHGIITVGLRPEPRAVRRRDLNDLSPRFLADLCRHYGPYSLKRLQQNMSTLKMHFTENDDIVQQVNVWILEAVAQFDDTKGVPFGAFLATKLTSWVHDLNRNAYGRVLTDHENKTSTVIAKFQQAHHRMPTDAELAEAMGQSVNNLRKNAQAVATVNGLRNIGTIDSGIDDPEIPLPDAARVEDQMMDDLEKSMLSQALTKSCAPDPTAKGRAAMPNVLAFVTWYGTTWRGMTKTELSARLDTSLRNMNVYTDRAGQKMASTLAAAN